ncbi:hypothetical protein B5U27_27410 [Pseudomonas amygdali pv. lachrymans]|nr:hypothetical protein B5U27_27410 [Pseudomonas amygdali pv. lachrymans]
MVVDQRHDRAADRQHLVQLHAHLKRRGITDTAGTRADKQEASGHRDGAMMDVYDLSIPLVNASRT